MSLVVLVQGLPLNDVKIITIIALTYDIISRFDVLFKHRIQYICHLFLKTFEYKPDYILSAFDTNEISEILNEILEYCILLLLLCLHTYMYINIGFIPYREHGIEEYF